MSAPSDAATPRSALRWVVVGLVVIGLVAVGFAIGRFSMFGNASAVASPGESSAEAGFSRDMQVHHTQAIEMAMEIYRKTDDDELRILSYDIATSQAAQKGEMFDWLVQWGLPQTTGTPLMEWMQQSSGHDHGTASDGEPLSDDELRAQMGMASSAELAELSTATGTEADCLFLELMIRHHEGAIPMAEALVELGTDARALQLAQTIITGQSAEIAAMQSMQNRLGCSG